MSEDLVPYAASMELADTRPPEKVVAEAVRAATILKDIVQKTGASIRLGNSEHLRVEAWITLARFYGLSPRIVRKQYVEYGPNCRGFEAVAELVDTATGRVISSAESMCLSDEERWSERPKYAVVDGVRRQLGTEQVPLFQLLSMAQTRAISKVCATALRWVVVLAGYSGTPAEEMTGNEVPAAAGGPTPATPEAPIQPPRANGQGEYVLPGALIEDVLAKTGTNKQGKEYTLYTILAGGERYTTFSEKLGAAAGKAAAMKTPVTLRYTMTEKGYRNLTGIESGGAGDE